MLKVQEYLKSGKSLQELESEFGIEHSNYGTAISLNYNQIKSPMSEEISKECRGLILRQNSWELLAYPFYKFFNMGEGNQAQLDWSTAKCLEKLDGTLIICWYDDEKVKWQFATRSVPYGHISINGANFSFSDLCVQALVSMYGTIENANENFYNKLNKKNTYMFELTSPYNQIVVRHNDVKLTLIGARNLETLKELDIEPIGAELKMPTPKTFPFSTIDDIINLINTWNPLEHEGIVAIDKNFNRVKIKSLAYCSVHGTISSMLASDRNIMTLILLQKDDDIVSLINGVVLDRYNLIKGRFVELYNAIEAQYNEIKQIEIDKEFAFATNSTLWPAPMFSLRRNKVASLSQFFEKCAEKQNMVDTVLRLIGCK